MECSTPVKQEAGDPSDFDRPQPATATVHRIWRDHPLVAMELIDFDGGGAVSAAPRNPGSAEARKRSAPLGPAQRGAHKRSRREAQAEVPCGAVIRCRYDGDATGEVMGVVLCQWRDRGDDAQDAADTCGGSIDAGRRMARLRRLVWAADTMLRDEAAPDEVFLVQDCPTVCLDDGFDLLDLGEAPGDWMLPDERAALDPALTESTSPGAQLRLRYEYVEAERVFRDLPTRAAMRIGHRAEQDERSAPAAGPSAGMSAATDRKPEPLRALELFPGVGTLSVGLEAAGASKTLWAFEGNVDAAFAMQASLPDAEIFLEDGGHGLRLACAAAAGSVAGDERLPRQGDVELVCGAPPCECLSNPNGGPPVPSMLSFNAFTPMFLSYCEFYQPSLIIMANAPEVATHYGGTTLQKIVRTMLELGYQVRFGEVSARAFGMESDQSWLFVIGARRGRKRIPELPSPAHLHALAGDAMDVDPEKPAAPFGV